MSSETTPESLSDVQKALLADLLAERGRLRDAVHNAFNPIGALFVVGIGWVILEGRGASIDKPYLSHKAVLAVITNMILFLGAWLALGYTAISGVNALRLCFTNKAVNQWLAEWNQKKQDSGAMIFGAVAVVIGIVFFATALISLRQSATTSDALVKEYNGRALLGRIIHPLHQLPLLHPLDSTSTIASGLGFFGGNGGKRDEARKRANHSTIECHFTAPGLDGIRDLHNELRHQTAATITLCLLRRFEFLHTALPLAGWLMRVFGTVIQVAALSMTHSRQNYVFRCIIASEFVGDDHTWLAPCSTRSS